MSVETRRSQDAFLYASEIAKPEGANCSSTRSTDDDASWQQPQEEAANLPCTGAAGAKASQLQHLSTK